MVSYDVPTFEKVRRHLVDLRIAIVPDHKPPALVEHAQSLRHVTQGRVESQVGARKFGGLLKESFLMADALGDVLVDRHPAAADNGRVCHRDHSAVAEPCDVCVFSSVKQVLPEFADIGLDLEVQIADLFTVRDDRVDVSAAFDDFAGHSVEFDVSVVPDHQPAIGVEHADPGRHVGERSVETRVGFTQLDGTGGQPPRRAPDEQAHEQDEARHRSDFDHPTHRVSLPRRQHFSHVLRDGDDDGIGLAPFVTVHPPDPIGRSVHLEAPRSRIFQLRKYSARRHVAADIGLDIGPPHEQRSVQ